MAKAKAKHYTELTVDKWNTAHFQAYLRDEHLKRFGIQYAPAGGVPAERALIARYIGTTRKAGIYDRETVKTFIDACFASYKPTPRYPGLTFWFMVTFMTNQLQQAELASKRKAAESYADRLEDLDGWL